MSIESYLSAIGGEVTNQADMIEIARTMLLNKASGGGGVRHEVIENNSTKNLILPESESPDTETRIVVLEGGKPDYYCTFAAMWVATVGYWVELFTTSDGSVVSARENRDATDIATVPRYGGANLVIGNYHLYII